MAQPKPYKELKFDGLCVRKREDESLEQMLKRFKKAVQKDGVLIEYRNRQYYTSPSVKRKQEQAAARRRAQRKSKSK